MYFSLGDQIINHWSSNCNMIYALSAIGCFFINFDHSFFYLYTYMYLQISASAWAAEAGDCSGTKTYHHKTNPSWNPRTGRGRCQGCQALGWWGCRCQCHWSKTTLVICTGLPVHIFPPGIDKNDCMKLCMDHFVRFFMMHCLLCRKWT